MPDIEPQTWILFGAGAVLVLALVAVAAARRGREEHEQEQKIRRSQTLRVVLVVFLLALIVAFAVVNAHSVAVDWVFTETRAPLVVIVGLSGGMGFLIGALLAYRSKSE
jgi:uncharacterized integral membrane protein